MDLVLFNTELSPFIFSLFARLTRSFFISHYSWQRNIF
ncbi:conserved domain protein [Streptococcus porcinus str. Jelinkova 176]|uniref:Conserved domain protein n=1 Tax=Streptococcus porcinus str. Jelinkova 176 TaxID=873448 RepID=A0ABP2KWY9_STRPO|nr:conserved domain protein [Streptococcus porcinus str. Jelinkova 176]